VAKPKGKPMSFLHQIFSFAYIEFETIEGFMRSKLLNETLFHGRQITVIPKRKNLPG